MLTDLKRIWIPDLFFRNEKQGHFHNIIMPNVLLRIYPNGTVLLSLRISLVLFCPMDLHNFPLDKQVCTIEMASCKCLMKPFLLLSLFYIFDCLCEQNTFNLPLIAHFNALFSSSSLRMTIIFHVNDSL